MSSGCSALKEALCNGDRAIVLSWPPQPLKIRVTARLPPGIVEVAENDGNMCHILLLRAMNAALSLRESANVTISDLSLVGQPVPSTCPRSGKPYIRIFADATDTAATALNLLNWEIQMGDKTIKIEQVSARRH